jgi:hypothetical protein
MLTLRAFGTTAAAAAIFTMCSAAPAEAQLGLGSVVRVAKKAARPRRYIVSDASHQGRTTSGHSPADARLTLR